MAQEALLSLALPSRRAERPSTSRRLTSLPRVAPTIRPSEETASTTSGSGLFQAESGWMPASIPVPTAAMGWHLVKISASGPMPTSRYWLQAPCWISTSFRCIGFGGAGFQLAQVVADEAGDFVADRAGGVHVAARAFLDDAFQHGDGEGDAGGLDRLEVDGCEQPGRVGSRLSGGVLASMASRVPIGSRRRRRAGQRRGRGSSQRSRMVG